MSEQELYPRIASKAKLRSDPKTGQKVLLSPEKGLILNATGERILALCDGQRTLDQVVLALRAEYDGAPVETLTRDVRQFLAQLRERGLIEGFEP